VEPTDPGLSGETVVKRNKTHQEMR